MLRTLQISKKQYYFEKSIVHVIKYANFQLYAVRPDGLINSKNLTIDDKFINKRVRHFMDQTCV